MRDRVGDCLICLETLQTGTVCVLQCCNVSIHDVCLAKWKHASDSSKCPHCSCLYIECQHRHHRPAVYLETIDHLRRLLVEQDEIIHRNNDSIYALQTERRELLSAMWPAMWPVLWPDPIAIDE